MGVLDSVRRMLYDSPFEVSINTALRYAPIVRELKRLKGMSPAISVLEVGSGSRGITRFFRHPVTGIDVEFPEPKNEYLKQVLFSADKRLPFSDGEFDVVVSVDTVEHIPKRKRDAALKEMLRVSRKHVLLAYPTGWTEWDEKVLRTWPKGSATYRNIKEHRECGMPDGSEIRRVFRGCRIREEEGTHPRLTYFIKAVERTFLGKALGRSVLKLGMPLFRRMNGQGRKVYLIEKPKKGKAWNMREGRA